MVPSVDPPSPSPQRTVGWMEKPTNLTRVYQTSCMPSLSSLSTRTTLFMPDMYDAVVAQRITSNRIELIYDHDSLEKLHRAKVVVSDDRVEGETFATGKVTIDGSWVEDQSQALDSLRLAVEAAIYGNK